MASVIILLLLGAGAGYVASAYLRLRAPRHTVIMAGALGGLIGGFALKFLLSPLVALIGALLGAAAIILLATGGRRS